MAPVGGGACKEAVKSHWKYANCEKPTTSKAANIGGKTVKDSVLSQGEKHGTHGVRELLQCSTCANSVYPPIHQCPNGHTVCLEKVAESFELPCRYQTVGCQDSFPYYRKAKHEKLCHFRPYNCPYASSECCMAGDIPFLVVHLKEDHSVDMHDGCTFNHRYVKSNPHEVEKATWMLTVFNCFGRQFCLHFEAFLLGTTPVYMAFLRFMGEDDEAKMFSYALEVSGFGRKLAWQGVPRSIRESHEKVRESHDGLIIPRDLALFFSAGDGQELKLRVMGRIWKA